MQLEKELTLEPLVDETQKVSSRNHLGHVDGLRALAAIYVVLHHTIVQAGIYGHQQNGLGKAAIFFYYGNYAVALFIVISGFCLMLPVARGTGVIRQGALNFIKRRFWRIVPPYYFAMVLSLLFIELFLHEKTGTNWDDCIPVTGRSILTHLLLVQDAFGDTRKISYPFWSISVEWRIYFFFPLMVWGWRVMGPLQTMVLTVLFMHGLSWLWQSTVGFPLAASYGVLFAMGMFAATLVWSPLWTRFKNGPWNLIVVVTSMLVVAVTAVKEHNSFAMPIYMINYCVGLWSVSLLVLSSRDNHNWLRQCLSFGPLVFIGTFSYSLYLIHAPLLQFLWQIVFAPLRTSPTEMLAVLTFIGFPLILVFSYLFFCVCERPFMHGKPDVFRRATHHE